MKSYANLCELFYDSVDTFRKPAHLTAKRGGAWIATSSEEYRRAVEETALGLRELGVGAQDRVAILSENRPEWAYVDLASLALGARDVPIYPTLTASHVAYILEDSGAKVVVASSEAQVRKLAQVRDRLPALRHVVAMDAPPGDGVWSLDDLRARGRQALAADPEAVRRGVRAVRSDDVATIIYTSGTTGDPKGVMLTHGNIVSNVEGGFEVFADWSVTDVALSFLPLSHIFERMAGHYLMLRAGATIAYAEGVEKVPQNMLEVRPTLMCSVPRLYEKMYARILEKVAAYPPLRQRVFHWALGVGRDAFACRVAGGSAGALLRAQRAVADALVFSKIREGTGGRLRLFVSGGAPLSKEIAEFFGAVGLTILEGYGLTETSPVIAVNRPERLRPGSVGPPLSNVEVRTAEDGEILTRGPHVMTGYFNKPEATAEAIDADGWFHTGDIGHLDADGFLFVTDRKKDILVTSGGKNIAPQPIENRLKTDPLIAEIVMVGNRRKFPAALIVPDFARLEEWARARGIDAADRDALVSRADVREAYERRVDELSADLAQFEKIKRIALVSHEFGVDTGELTPTLKVKRRFVEEKYKPLIDQLYGSD